MKTAFLGSGNMARAIIGGMVKTGTAPSDLLVVNPGNPKSCGEVQALYGAVPTQPEGLSQADVVVLAFKPQTFPDAAPVYRPVIREDALVVSIMAGVSIGSIEAALGAKKVVRVMPNLAHAVGKGASGYAMGSGVSEGDARIVEEMLSASGAVVRVEERQINDVGALSGSGPAYICLLLEALCDAAVQDGMDPATAAILAKQTLLGTAALLEQEDLPPQELRRRVTSKKGTTEAAINAMCAMQFPQAVQAGYEANKRRSEALAAESL